MFFKLTQLTLCAAFALTVMSQDGKQITNGPYKCGSNTPTYNPNALECKDPDYDGTIRFQSFGIDCCNEVANNSMKNFQKLLGNVSLSLIKAVS